MILSITVYCFGIERYDLFFSRNSLTKSGLTILVVRPPIVSGRIFAVDCIYNIYIIFYRHILVKEHFRNGLEDREKGQHFNQEPFNDKLVTFFLSTFIFIDLI